MSRRPSEFDLVMPRVDPRACENSWTIDFWRHRPTPRCSLSVVDQEWIRNDDTFDHGLGAVVADDTPKTLRNATETIARYFRREFRYDFVQYSATERDPLGRAFLWIGPDDVVVGAGCFRWRDDPEVESAHYGMQWVWLHPYERRRGRLSRAWPYFRARFGPFKVEPPLSDAMIAFLNDPERHR